MSNNDYPSALENLLDAMKRYKVKTMVKDLKRFAKNAKGDADDLASRHRSYASGASVIFDKDDLAEFKSIAKELLSYADAIEKTMNDLIDNTFALSDDAERQLKE